MYFFFSKSTRRRDINNKIFIVFVEFIAPFERCIQLDDLIMAVYGIKRLFQIVYKVTEEGERIYRSEVGLSSILDGR